MQRNIAAFGGETKSLSAWARDKRCKVGLGRLRYRIVELGMQPEIAMTETKKMYKRVSFSAIEKLFDENGCELLLSEKDYKDTRQKLPYRCNCGNESEISYCHFKDGHRCNDCGRKIVEKARRLTYDYVKQAFAAAGCKLLSQEYKNIYQKLDYICVCGKASQISYQCFKRGHLCKECGSKKNADSRRHNYDYVKQAFVAAGCKLLSQEYKSAIAKLDFVCSCGHNSQITFHSFQRGCRCKWCKESKGEKTIASILEKYDIQYRRETIYDDCKRHKKLRFDFEVSIEGLMLLIEYQGEHHYKPVYFRGKKTKAFRDDAMKHFDTMRKSDEIKRQYCKSKGVSLLEIPYWDFKNIEEILINFLGVK